MKKTLTALILILIVALTGCGGMAFLAPEEIDLNKAYSFSASMQFASGGGEFSAVANFSRQGEGVWNVTFAEPYALAGMELTYEAGNVTSAFEGAQFTATANSNAIVTQIITAFENAINGEGREIIAGGRGAEEIRVKSKVGERGRSFELVLCKKTHRPLTLTFADNSLTVDFSEVQVSPITRVIRPGSDSEPPATTRDPLRMD
jgi:hypothetical protein